MDMKKVGPAGLTAEVADRLLDLLSTDDAFRAQFVADPSAALRVAGYVAPANSDENFADPGQCLLVTALASKEQIASARDTLNGSLMSIFGFSAPQQLRG
jgi:putative modified peptide